MHVYIYVCIHMYAYKCVHVYMYTHIYVYIYMYMYVWLEFYRGYPEILLTKFFPQSSTFSGYKIQNVQEGV